MSGQEPTASWDALRGEFRARTGAGGAIDIVALVLPDDYGQSVLSLNDAKGEGLPFLPLHEGAPSHG